MAGKSLNPCTVRVRCVLTGISTPYFFWYPYASGTPNGFFTGEI